MRHSIKFKFFAASCAIAVAFIGIFSALNLTLYDDYYLWQREKSLDRIYDTVCDAYQDGGAAFADAIARAEDTEGVRLSIVAQDGTVTYDSVVREQFMGADGTSESLFYGLSHRGGSAAQCGFGAGRKAGFGVCQRILEAAGRRVPVSGRQARKRWGLYGRTDSLHLFGAEYQLQYGISVDFGWNYTGFLHDSRFFDFAPLYPVP